MKLSLNAFVLRCVAMVAVVAGAVYAPVDIAAFDTVIYAASSRLSQGRFVKIRVKESGMHLITNTELKRYGFPNPEKVRVYGYGARCSDDILSIDRYIDDLPETASELTSDGIVFYANGPIVWSLNSDGHLTHSRNYYSDYGYYFLAESEDKRKDIPTTATPTSASNLANSFTDVMLHESELVSGGKTGHTLLGEDFSSTQSRTFSFTPVNPLENSKIWVSCAFASKTVNGSASVSISANNGEKLASATIEQTDDDSYSHYRMKYFDGTASIATGQQNISVNYSPTGKVKLARLDYLCINYSRQLAMTDGLLNFRISDSGASLSGATADTRIWDVTSPDEIRSVNAALNGSDLQWIPSLSGLRQYAAWQPGAKMLTPEFVGEVTASNIHGADTPDMVIITTEAFRSQAKQIAALHSDMKLLVVTAEEVFNEFSSGTPDYMALRRMLKMFYDRGGLKYALMFGRGIYDHRQLTDAAKNLGYPVLMQWQSVDGANDNTSFTTEDYLAFLSDGAGANPATDYHCIAVGRIPVSTASEADAAVSKLKAYMADADRSDWKNRILLTSDDGDEAVHITQMEKAYNSMIASDAGANYLYNKVYVDAYQVVDRVAQGANERMFRELNRGTLWWWYTGHADEDSWTTEGLLTASDLKSIRFAHQPMLYAATCDFLRWDLAEQSGAEQLFFNTSGVIGAIAATRPVYISMNLDMSLAVAATMFDTDADGSPIPVGEILRRAKNRLLSPADSNKLRYVLLGDPALKLASADLRAVIETINGSPVSADTPATVSALGTLSATGRIVDSNGNIVSDFDGTLTPTLYDAEYSTTTLGRDGPEVTFEEQGNRLAIGREAISGGRFDFTLTMPSQIADNYRPAALNLYAVAADERDAAGVCRNLYVYGYNDNVSTDTVAPVIEEFVLNSSSFRSGDAVNTSPMVIARVSDDVAINISGAGIGQRMSLLLDNNKSLSDVEQYFTPGDDGARSGTISYQLSDLAEGDHSLRLRVWDISGNFAEQTIFFSAVAGLSPDIVDLYVDNNPAVDCANFYVRHNRPDAMIEVSLVVYDMMGRMVWSTVQAGRSDGFISAPIKWDLTDRGGRRVPRGIYIYRAIVTCDGAASPSAARKLAVTS